MSASHPRTIGLGITLFLLSALLTYTFRASPPSQPNHHTRPVLTTATPRLAFATFLAANANPDRAPTDAESAAINDIDDGYFLGVRVLAYQLLHSPVTATNLSIPFLVLVTSDVSARKRARLAADGATVLEVPKLSVDWVHPASARWADVMAKLRLWELEGYSRICFMDSDTLVTRRLDDVFFDEAVLTQATLPRVRGKDGEEGRGGDGKEDDLASGTEGGGGDGDVLPRSYVFASHIDFYGYEHAWPPDATKGYFNVGFFVTAPDRRVFRYYLRLLEKEGKFDPSLPEQNLLNFAHRKEGRMPWTRLWHGWNVNWPTEKDWRRGVATFHGKYWDTDPAHDKVLKGIWREQRAEMEGYWRGREGRRERFGGRLGEH